LILSIPSGKSVTAMAVTLFDCLAGTRFIPQRFFGSPVKLSAGHPAHIWCRAVSVWRRTGLNSVGGLSIPEIAAALSLNVSTVKTRLYRKE